MRVYTTSDRAPRLPGDPQDGYAYRASLIADGVRSCAVSTAPTGAPSPASAPNPRERAREPRNPKVLSSSDLAAAAAYEIALTIASGIQEGAGA